MRNFKCVTVDGITMYDFGDGFPVRYEYLADSQRHIVVGAYELGLVQGDDCSVEYNDGDED